MQRKGKFVFGSAPNGMSVGSMCQLQRKAEDKTGELRPPLREVFEKTAGHWLWENPPFYHTL